MPLEASDVNAPRGPVSTVAPRPQRDAGASAPAAFLFEELQRTILDGIRPVVFITLGVVVVYLAIALALRQASIWQAAQVVIVAIMTVGLSGRYAVRRRARVAVVGLLLFSFTALLNYGALIGTGLLFVVAALAGSFFFGARGAAVCTVTLIAFLVATALAAHVGLVHPGLRLTGVQWARTSVSVALALSAATYLFTRVQALTRRSIEEQVAALARQRAMEEERERMLRASAASQRLESLGRLAGGVAHDFNNALSVVLAGTEALREAATPAERAQILDDLEQSVRGAGSTARQLLAFSRGNPAQDGECDAATLVERFAKSIRRMLPADIEIVVECSGSGYVALAAPQLEQALLNLVINARDAMPGGGTLTLRARREGDQVVLEVVDQGIGMSASVQLHVFEPFFTTKGDAGNGLGLAMVWGTVTRVGGQVEVDSAVGRGSTFRIRLPFLGERAPAAPQAAARSRDADRASGHGSRTRILLLEDEPALRRSMERVLTRAGYEVSSHETARSAMDHLGDRSFHFLVTDCVVPGGGVPDLIRAFQARHRGAPVLVCSGYVREQVVLDGIAADEYLFLEKPFAPHALVDLIARTVASVAA